MKTIKVGCMPGKLQVLEVREGETARELIQRAGLEYSNHEIRLDGSVINLDTDISNGSLCVIMSRIKGNVEYDYVTELCKEDVKGLLDLDEEIPTIIESDFVEIEGSVIIIGNGYSIPYVTVDAESFLSIYDKVERPELRIEYPPTSYETIQITPVEHKCKCASAKEIIEKELKELRISRDKWLAFANEESAKINVLNKILDELNK